ncbi:MAG: flagellar hook-length control protein FliK [Desulfatiglandales bacterium]
MDQVSIKIASLPTNHQSDLLSKSLGAGKGSDDFSSAIRGLMNPIQRNSLKGSTKPLHSGLAPKKGYHAYLESLRKGLLAKGKPLNELSLKKEDLSVLKEFLRLIGFSKEDVEKVLKGLAQNNPRGDINLSQFFMKIAELDPPKKKIDQSVTLEPSAIPHIESLLRYLGMTPKEVDHVLRAGRVEGGGLDLEKLLINLKETSKNIKGRTQLTIDQNSVHQILNKLESLGIHMPNKEKGGQISIKDFITALEQMTGRTEIENQLPSDVKTSIEQVLEKAVFAHNGDEDESIFPPLSKLRSNHPYPEKETGEKRTRVAKGSLITPPSMEKVGKGGNRVERGDTLSPLTKEGKTNAQANALSELDVVQELKGTDKGEGPWAKSQARAVDIPHDTHSAAFSETIKTVGENQNPIRHALPSYLINQVGKQIARSILKGEKVIRLQLRPPDLGVVKVEMDMKDNILKLGIITENSSVKELLLSNVHELRETLVQQGVRLERVDIQISYDFDQALANSKEGLKEGQREMQEPNGLSFTEEGEMEDPLTMTRFMKNSNQLLDLVA